MGYREGKARRMVYGTCAKETWTLRLSWEDRGEGSKQRSGKRNCNPPGSGLPAAPSGVKGRQHGLPWLKNARELF